jgi:biotin carboxyl carrier protein
MAFDFLVDGERHALEIVGRRPGLVVRVDGRDYRIAAAADAIVVDGQRIELATARRGDRHFLKLAGRHHEVVAIDPREEATAGVASHAEIRAPMPGVVVSLQRAVGDTVARGEVVATIESMKLQTALASPVDGVIEAIGRQEGEKFEKDEVLVRFDTGGSAAAPPGSGLHGARPA